MAIGERPPGDLGLISEAREYCEEVPLRDGWTPGWAITMKHLADRLESVTAEAMTDPWCFGWWEWDAEKNDWLWKELPLFEEGTYTRGHIVFRKNAVEEQPGHEKNKPTWKP